MFFNELGKPPFQVQYQNYLASFFIDGGDVKGKLPLRGMRLVEKWRDLHQEELLRNWGLARKECVLEPINPLE